MYSPFSTIRRDPQTGELGVSTDYWLAVLHKRLVGTAALRVTLPLVGCSTPPARPTLPLVSRSCLRTLARANGLHLPRVARLRSGGPIYVYALTHGKTDTDILLNGHSLVFNSSTGTYPSVPITELALPATSYGFVSFPDAQVAACRN